MTAGRLVLVGIGCLLLGLLAAIITKNIFVGISFPFLLVVFILMWNKLKGEGEKKEKDSEVIAPEEEDKTS